MPPTTSVRRGLLVVIVGAVALFASGAAFGAVVLSGEESADRPAQRTMPPPVTEAPAKCKPGALARAPWGELSGSVHQLLDLTGSLSSYEPVDPSAVGLAQAGDLGLGDQSSGVFAFQTRPDTALALAQVTVASSERDRKSLRSAAGDEAQLERALIDGLVASGVNAAGIHGPVLWDDMQVAGWEAKVGRLSVDFPELAVGASVAVLVGECGDNLVAVSSFTLNPQGLVSSYSAHDVALFIWRRVENL